VKAGRDRIDSSAPAFYRSFDRYGFNACQSSMFTSRPAVGVHDQPLAGDALEEPSDFHRTRIVDRKTLPKSRSLREPIANLDAAGQSDNLTVYKSHASPQWCPEMFRSVFSVIVAVVLTAPCAAQGKRDADKPPPNAETWTYRATKGELVRGGELRIFGGRIWYKDEITGSLSVKGDQAVLVFYSTRTLNGRAALKRDPSDGAWRGVLLHADRSQWQLVLTPIVADPPKDGPKEKPKDKRKRKESKSTQAE
jgi:hypothetical protein